MTHAMIVAGAGATTAGDTTIGTIELPQRDQGGWIIHHVFGQVAAATATAAEQTGGHFRLSPAQGELIPHPAPSRFPIFQSGSFLGATAPVMSCPLNLIPVEYEASGQARIDLIYNNSITLTVASQVVLGCIFSDERPAERPIRFCDRVRTTITSAADTSVGTITLSQNAQRIIGACGVLQQNGVLTTAEELIGFFRLESDDVKLVPMMLPFSTVFGAGLGATISGGQQFPPKFIPLDIPLQRGTRIDCFVDLNTAVTNGANVEIYVAYE